MCPGSLPRATPRGMVSYKVTDDITLGFGGWCPELGRWQESKDLALSCHEEELPIFLRRPTVPESDRGPSIHLTYTQQREGTDDRGLGVRTDENRRRPGRPTSGRRVPTSGSKR